jgi:TolA-binding protein
LARAADGQAGAGASDEKQKNVALAYMRAATFGEKLDGKPHVAECLMKTAGIEEALKDTKAAVGLYQQVADDPVLKRTPEAQAAKKAVDRLKAAGA